MRAISPHGRYSIQLFESRPTRGVDSSGTTIEYETHKPVVAQFEQGGLMKWEEQAALESFNFSGLAEGVHPLTTVGVYDTELAVQGIADRSARAEFQKRIEDRLVELQTIFPNQYIIVEKPALAKPWPSYDETAVEDIEAVMAATGVSADAVIAYETENEQRGEVLDLLNAIQAETLEAGIEVRLS